MKAHTKTANSPCGSTWRRILAAAVLAVAAAGCQTSPPAPEAAPASRATPPQREALKALGFAETDDAWMLSMEGPLVFEVDSDLLTPDMAEAIAKVAQGLVKVGITNVRVEGHTDSTGSRSYNLSLSKRRAAAVARQLATAGFPAEGIDQRALAFDYPLAPNATREGRAQNRRVTITVMAQPAVR